MLLPPDLDEEEPNKFQQADEIILRLQKDAETYQDEIKQLRQMVSTQKNMQSVLGNRINNAQHTLDSAQKENATLKLQIIKLGKQSCSDSTKSGTQESNESHESPKAAQLDDLNRRLSQMIMQNQELEKKVVGSQQEVDEYQSQLSLAEQNIERQNDLLDEYKEAIRAQELVNLELKMKIDQVSTINMEMVLKVDEVTKINIKLELEIEEQ